MDMMALLEEIAVPRPNHSDALGETAELIKSLLASWGIPFSVQEFPLRPYMMLIMGLAVLLLAALLAFAVYRKKPWVALFCALAIPLLLVAEFELFIPVLSWIIRIPGENIIVSFTPPDPVRELIFAAHYDSKTDFWDHIQRGRVYQFIPAAFILGILLAVFTFIVKRKAALSRRLPRAISLALAGLLAAYMGLLALGFGGFVFIPRERWSPGAVDNGGSVVSLLALARDIQGRRVDPGPSKVTILFTSGEEVLLQGAHHYVREHVAAWKNEGVPRFLVNLELAGQGGNLFYAGKSGVFIKYYNAAPELVKRVGAAWKALTGRGLDSEEKITDDSQRFMAAGIPSITIGHNGTPGPGMGGLHSAEDSMQRVDRENLYLMVRVLGKIIEGFR